MQVGSTSDYPVNALSNSLSARFPKLSIRTTSPLLDYDEAYDSRRKQYHSTRLLVLLERQTESSGVDRVLGVPAFDLFVPDMNFVFGEARCPGRAAVVSTFRLRESVKTDILGARFLKEVMHEVGHMFGLKHCSDELCVMHFSESLRDTDKKGEDYCERCRSESELSGAEQGV
jgi:archaemetzincin